MILTCTLETPLGTIRAAASLGEGAKINAAALCGLWFIDQKYFPRNINGWIARPECPVFLKLTEWIDGYFSKKKNLPRLPLAPHGTAFQQAVWALLLDIPYGATCTYGEIAKKISAGKPNPGIFVRAVAGAVGHNPLSLLIPCHRVIGADGGLKGYAGGVSRKRALLELEGFYTL